MQIRLVAGPLHECSRIHLAAGIVLPRIRVVLALAAPPVPRMVASLLPTFLRDWWGFFFAYPEQ